MVVYDTSFNRPPPNELRPGDGIMVYSSRDLDKVPSPEECTAYRTHGNPVGFVFEDKRGRAVTGTYSDGFDDGILSAKMAYDRGHASGLPHYVACDVPETINIEYARGFEHGLDVNYIPGLYAGDRNLELVRVQLNWKRLWQANAQSWSDHWEFDHNGNPLPYGSYWYANIWQTTIRSTIPGTDLNASNPAHPYWNSPLQNPIYAGDEMPIMMAPIGTNVRMFVSGSVGYVIHDKQTVQGYTDAGVATAFITQRDFDIAKAKYAA